MDTVNRRPIPASCAFCLRTISRTKFRFGHAEGCSKAPSDGYAPVNVTSTIPAKEFMTLAEGARLSKDWTKPGSRPLEEGDVEFAWTGPRTTKETEADERKATPIYSGVLKYFPKAIADLARCSLAGSRQHHGGTALWWDRSKSGDELDALTRHLMAAGTLDSDGVRHSTKVLWRAAANLEKELEDAEGDKQAG
jgi:hypothetical protein